MRRRTARTTNELGACHLAASDARLAVAWHLLAGAGMHVGEVLALRWEDVETETGRISVRNAVVGVPYALLAVPPASPGARVITASPDGLDALRRRRRAVEHSEREVSFHDADLVVCHENGWPMHPRNLREWLTAAGLPAIGLVSTRQRAAAMREEVLA